ncbi:uncharacterized protein LOC124885628 isoform X1 [Capsicum annuum]|uniref:uncharacterized protein LOC124885628 isoform X1 n=1 Tax=Capsicum annuum TaxID=4072 RepID=UPI001FB08793|nr:uncharacterized protein LOC124885628 isoform X1 [Capsicum annuum]
MGVDCIAEHRSCRNWNRLIGMHLNAIKNLKLEGISSTLYVIAYHHIYGTFATGSCNGDVNFWDGNNKKRLYQLNICSRAFCFYHYLSERLTDKLIDFTGPPAVP